MMASKGHFCMTYKRCASGGQSISIAIRESASQQERAHHAMTGQLIPAAIRIRHRDVTFTQIPQPMHSSSEIHAVFELGVTSMQSLPAQRQEAINESARHGFWSKLLDSVVSTLTYLHHRTALLALLPAFLRFAPAMNSES